MMLIMLLTIIYSYESLSLNHNQDIILYKEYKKNIIENDMDILLKKLSSHRVLKFSDQNMMIAFALEINKSPFTLEILEEKIIKYLKNKEPIFTALRKAIERTSFHNFKVKRNEEVMHHMDMFTKSIIKLGLAKTKEAKVINAYAVCIDAFNHDDYRDIIKPQICDPIDDYKHPRYYQNKIAINTNLSSFVDIEMLAYNALVHQAQSVANNRGLSLFEKIKMAKCISEQALKFIEPSKWPLLALKKTYDMSRKTMDKAYFMTTGVCGNFSAIAYNIAHNLLIPNDSIYIVNKNVHIYLEFADENNNWYHTHPFNSKSSCDIIRF